MVEDSFLIPFLFWEITLLLLELELENLQSLNNNRKAINTRLKSSVPHSKSESPSDLEGGYCHLERLFTKHFQNIVVETLWQPSTAILTHYMAKKHI